MRRTTRKPCPGCGEIKYRNADDVCEACRDDIKEGRAARARAKRVKDVEVVSLPFAPHGLEYIPHLRSFDDESVGDGIRSGIFSLAEVIGEKVSSGDSIFNQPKNEVFAPMADRFHPSLFYRMPKGVRPIIYALYERIIRVAEQAHDEGYGKGHNLIVGLAKGDVSIDTLNQATIGERLAKRKRRRR